MAIFSTYNYLVPAAGTTSAYTLDTTSTPAAAQLVNFTQVGNNGIDFNPSGVQIDNVNGTEDVTIKILPIGFTIKCPMGKQMGAQFPAPAGCTAEVTASGAVLAFVDYPVIPYLF